MQTGIKHVGINVGLKPNEEAILKLLIVNADETAAGISEKLGISQRTVERMLKSLREKGYIVRQGSRRSGSWKIIK